LRVFPRYIPRGLKPYSFQGLYRHGQGRALTLLAFPMESFPGRQGVGYPIQRLGAAYSLPNLRPHVTPADRPVRQTRANRPENRMNFDASRQVRLLAPGGEIAARRLKLRNGIIAFYRCPPETRSFTFTSEWGESVEVNPPEGLCLKSPTFWAKEEFLGRKLISSRLAEFGWVSVVD